MSCTSDHLNTPPRSTRIGCEPLPPNSHANLKNSLLLHCCTCFSCQQGLTHTQHGSVNHSSTLNAHLWGAAHILPLVHTRHRSKSITSYMWRATPDVPRCNTNLPTGTCALSEHTLQVHVVWEAKHFLVCVPGLVCSFSRTATPELGCAATVSILQA